MTRTVFAHIVTFNNGSTIRRCLDALLSQEGFTPGRSLLVHITDNASSDATRAEIPAGIPGVSVDYRAENTGFCAGHNWGAARFLAGSAEFLLILNPDVRLAPSALHELTAALASDDSAGSACPKLLRADGALNPVEPRRLDAAGMHLTPELRHFDRGSEELDRGEFDHPAYVFGGSGACLLLSRRAVESLLLEAPGADRRLHALYPFLTAAGRAPLFDEAFFAYREDADLAWRAQILGWRCRYAPRAIGFHQRVVTPERRAELPPLLNRLSVRNRFLLQLNNFTPRASLAAFFRGAIVRNLLVIAALPVRERSSLGALREAAALAPRAVARRKVLMSRARASARSVARWFSQTEEPCGSN